MSRGDRRKLIFKDDQDRESFLLERCMEERRAAEDSRAYRPLRRGWCFGDRQFRRELLAEIAGGIGAEHCGEARREREAEQAERIVRSEVRRAGWSEEKLDSTPNGHKLKVRATVRLRAERTVSHGSIAERLRMGSRSNVSNLVYAKQKCQK